MKNNEYKSPVVYWTSEWIETGETRYIVKKDGTREKVPKLTLQGEKNENYRRKKL